MQAAQCSSRAQCSGAVLLLVARGMNALVAEGQGQEGSLTDTSCIWLTASCFRKALAFGFGPLALTDRLLQLLHSADNCTKWKSVSLYSVVQTVPKTEALVIC